MSERDGDGWKFTIILMALLLVLTILVNQRQSDWIRDLQRRVGQLESERR